MAAPHARAVSCKPGLAEPCGVVGGCPGGLRLLAGGAFLAGQLGGGALVEGGLLLVVVCPVLGECLDEGDDSEVSCAARWEL
jgi:hypothetical protein